jgi:hypothetical protein
MATIVDPIPRSTGLASTKIGGFEMAFGLFNFHMDDADVVELISMTDSATPAADPTVPSTEVTQLAVENTSSSTSPPTSVKVDPTVESSTPSVGSNDFQDPPPSPSTTYCVDCDAYHFVGDGDFLLHEIAGCEDPRGGTAAIYPTISECEWALNALTLQLAPYDPDYVEGLYSDNTYSDDDFYPEAKGKIDNLGSSSSIESAISGSGYIVDYDSDMMIEACSCIGDDDIYPLVQGEISDDSVSPSGRHCMMASHGEGNKNRANTT